MGQEDGKGIVTPARSPFAAAGPALPNGAPPTTLPTVVPVSSPSATAAPATSPLALGTGAGDLLATPPDRRSGPASATWAR